MFSKSPMPNFHQVQRRKTLYIPNCLLPQDSKAQPFIHKNIECAFRDIRMTVSLPIHLSGGASQLKLIIASPSHTQAPGAAWPVFP